MQDHIKQLNYESIVVYKERFDHIFKNYITHGNAPIGIVPAYMAIDSMNSSEMISSFMK
jgi:hypothetical protein